MKTTVQMAKEAGFTWEPINNIIGPLERFEALVRADEQANAFRAGVLYAAKKYAEVSEDRFTGNDVNLFLEMEEAELSDEDIAAIRARGNT